MISLFSRFKKGILWVLLGIFVVAVSLTAQAPKAPTSNQPVSEVERYVFWSTPLKSGDYKYGFLDTKRGRVWEYNTTAPIAGFYHEEWLYSDLNEDLIKDHERALLSDEHEYINSLLKEGKDTTGLGEKSWRFVDSATAEYAKWIRQKEK